MIRRTEQPTQNIDLKTISKGNNEGDASESLKQGGADDLRLYNVVDFKLPRRRLQLAGPVADTPASVLHDGREELALRTSTQTAREPRQENLSASVSYDLWRFSCEMPDAPHLCENSSPP
jgi:hypothetical protein